MKTTVTITCRRGGSPPSLWSCVLQLRQAGRPLDDSKVWRHGPGVNHLPPVVRADGWDLILMDCHMPCRDRYTDIQPPVSSVSFLFPTVRL